jgi:hypothetical protein
MIITLPDSVYTSRTAVLEWLERHRQDVAPGTLVQVRSESGRWECEVKRKVRQDGTGLGWTLIKPSGKIYGARRDYRGEKEARRARVMIGSPAEAKKMLGGLLDEPED